MSQRILVIGTGNMGSSLIRGLSRAKTSAQIFAVDDHAPKLQSIREDFPSVTTFTSLAEAAKGFWPAEKPGKAAKPKKGEGRDCVILCVKPQDLSTVARVISGRGHGDTTMFISILAGVTIADVSAALKFSGPIVRGMPNIAAMIGAAATALAANDLCDDQARAWALEIFGAVGLALWAKEQHMDAVTGLSGSGPAYIYMVIEALTDGGVKMGLPRDLAGKLAAQTVLGSAMLVQHTGLHPAILRDQVTTPGGTTINAIHELESHGLRAMLISAVATATERSKFLRTGRESR